MHINVIKEDTIRHFARKVSAINDEGTLKDLLRFVQTTDFKTKNLNPPIVSSSEEDQYKELLEKLAG